MRHNYKWTREEAMVVADQVREGMTKEQMAELHGVTWPCLYKVMNQFGVYPHAKRVIGVVQLKKLHDQWLDGKDIHALAATLGISEPAIRSRWRRMGLRTSKAGLARFPARRLDWKIGLTIWTMRSKGKSTQEICAAIGRAYEGEKSSRYIRHHLLRWCFDTHTKVPSFEYGTFKVKWLPPPTKPPTGKR